jgi:hypothetical protein
VFLQRRANLESGSKHLEYGLFFFNAKPKTVPILKKKKIPKGQTTFRDLKNEKYQRRATS